MRRIDNRSGTLREKVVNIGRGLRCCRGTNASDALNTAGGRTAELSTSDRNGESQLDWTCLRRNVDVEEQEEADLECLIVKLSVL